MTTIAPRGSADRDGRRDRPSGPGPAARGTGRTSLPKCPTGIQGFDEVTHGGLPRDRSTLICGGPGCGKTLFAIEFLVHGATRYDEPGVLIAFEETVAELSQNAASLGFDLDTLVARKLLVVDYVHVEPGEIQEVGDFDLEGLFIRLGHAIDSVGAKRVVIDTLEVLLAGLPNPAVLRSELRRLFRWMKDRGVTSVVTAELGNGALTRHGLEEYISDCVVHLDQRVNNQISTRRLRVLKYRGSTHDPNEIPYLIDDGGFSVLPISSLDLCQRVLSERVSWGIPDVDALFGGQGVYRGSSVLVTGTAGSGKSSLAAQFAVATCEAGRRSLYFAFEESSFQIIRNMLSIGIDLRPWEGQGLLRFHAARPTAHGLELHLAQICKAVVDFGPDAVIVDPISNLVSAGTNADARLMLIRLVDFLKSRQVTTLMTSLAAGPTSAPELSDQMVSSLVDTWLILSDLECNGERNRGLSIVKSRGTAHSNQVREFRLTGRGIELAEVYVGPEGVLTGASKVAREARERIAILVSRESFERKQRAMGRRRASLEAQIEVMRADLEAEEAEMAMATDQEGLRQEAVAHDLVENTRARTDHLSQQEPRPASGRKEEGKR